MANTLTDAEKEIVKIRAKNLDTVIGRPGERGRISDFAEKYDLNTSYVSQVINGHKDMGDKAARRYEAMLSLPSMALDNPEGPHATQTESKNLTPDQAELVERYDSLPPEAQKAFLVFLESLEAR